MQDEEDTITIVQRMSAQFQKPINKSDQEYIATCSTGVAHYPNHGKFPEDLIQNADTALYYVKERVKMILGYSINSWSINR